MLKWFNKNQRVESEYKDIPYRLKQICEYFIELSNSMGIDPVITRIKEPVAGETGVHLDNRAVDFRNELVYLIPETMQTATKYLYTNDQALEIVRSVNEKFPRFDGHQTCLDHSFQGGPRHFHVQVSKQDSFVLPPPDSGTINQ